MTTSKASDILARARKVLTEEQQAIPTLSENLGDEFVAVVREIMKCRGQVIITGLGKSGLIGRKLAATLSSTGTPAVFIHPVEGLHGDIGIVTKKDLLLAISKSGHSGELVKFIQSYKRLGGVAVAVTEGLKSPMARLCDMILPLPKLPEADEMDLAPTTSTTVTLALGDAIAVTLLWLRGFGPQDFAKYHPDGTLGRRLLLCARDLMHAEEKLPVVTTADTMKAAIGEITSKGLGVTCVVDDEGRFVGTITDGDLRRLMEKASNMLSLTTGEALELSRRKAGPVGPFTVGPETPAIECREIMNKHKIKDLVVLQNEKPVGVVRIYEITAAGL